MPFTLASPQVQEGKPITKDVTCDGGDTSPALSWTGAPAGTAAFALVFDDPDAPGGTWTHWTWWDLPSTATSVPAKADVTKLGGVQGTTSARSVGYHGPCPPSGRHRYVFTLHALRVPLGLPSGAGVAEVHAALQGKSLASCRLMGTYQRV